MEQQKIRKLKAKVTGETAPCGGNCPKNCPKMAHEAHEAVAKLWRPPGSVAQRCFPSKHMGRFCCRLSCEPLWRQFQDGTLGCGAQAPAAGRDQPVINQRDGDVSKKYVNIPSGKYIYVHKYVYICVYTYLCKMDEYRYYAGLS